MVNKPTDKKKHIFYIDRDYFDGRHIDDVSVNELTTNQGYQNFVKIRNELKKRFDLSSWAKGLDEGIISFLDIKSSQGINYDCLITHLPFSNSPVSTKFGRGQYYTKFYEPALGILRNLRAARKELPIIAYTGGDVNYIEDLLLAPDIAISAIIQKSGKTEEDLREIKSHLARLLNR